MTTTVAQILALEQRWLSGSGNDGGLNALRVQTLDSADGPATHRTYGAFVLGPVLTLFAEWVVAECVRMGQPAVHCLMREGHLLAPLIEQAARSAGVALDVHQLWASRYGVRSAFYQEGNEDELRHYFRKRSSVPLALVARDLDLDLSELRAFSRVDHDQPLSSVESDLVVRAIVGSPRLRARVVEVSADKRRRLFRYFESEDVFSRDRLMVVDLGWGGTIQTMLKHVFRDVARPTAIHGLYLATHEKILELPPGCTHSSFLFDARRPRVTCDILLRSPEILEHSCMPAAGSFETIDEAGAVRTFDQLLSGVQVGQIGELQAGVHAFADLWFARTGEQDRAGLLDRLRAILARAVQNPTLEEARLFEQWEHDSNDGTPHTEPLLGPERLRSRARFMTYDQMMRLSYHEIFWPQALARLVGRTEDDSFGLWRSALRYPAVRGAALFVSASAEAISRVLTRLAR